MSSPQRLVRVFVSHTSDMALFPAGRSFVQAVLDAVGRAEMVAVDMRYFAAREGKPAEYCRQRVRDCEIYVAVVGFRYGSIVPGEEVSYTELEFNEAGAAGLPRLVFLLDDAADAPVRLGDVDREVVDRFRQRLRDAGLVVRTFTSDASLELEVFHALTDTVDTRRPPPPRELPMDVSAFTGRAGEIAALDDLLGSGGAGPRAVVISAVSGTAGVGKTALAVHWAHRVAGRFPDGHLYVDLRGYDPDQPVPATDALATMLRALGVGGADIPYEAAERAARYRGLLAGRRMLVLLDNARSVEQTRLLLPGTASCLTVITSRDSLAALVARHGARRIDLDLLPLDDAVALLRALIGGRVDAEPDAAATLAQHCARLPLALRVAAEFVASHPSVSLIELVNELADRQRRLDLMEAGGDPRTAVRAVFSWSYNHLTSGAARAFRLLGLHPGPEFDPYATAALTSTGLEQARLQLDLLARAHLVHVTSAERFGMHDLLRAYAAELTTAQESGEERRASLTRLFDHYLATAAIAMDVLHPAERHRRLPIQPAGSFVPPVADPAAALAWLDSERPNLVAVCSHAGANGWPGHAARLAITLFRYLDTGGHHTEALAIHTHARRAASHAGDLTSEGHTTVNLAMIHFRQGRHTHAVDNLEQAVTSFRRGGDRAGEGRALTNLGLVHWRQGLHAQAVDDLELALPLLREAGDRPGEAHALHDLGLVHGRQGRYAEAGDDFQQSLAICTEIGDRVGEAYALNHLGLVSYRQRQYARAIDQLERALTLFRATDHRYGEAHALTNLGTVHGIQGRHMLAADYHRRALALFHEIGDRGGEAYALNGLGETLHVAGLDDQAGPEHTAALALAVETGDRFEEARAHTGLARTHQAVGDRDRVGRHLQRALVVYADLDVPEVDDVRASLAALNQETAGGDDCS